jgi:hypothetical protein
LFPAAAKTLGGRASRADAARVNPLALLAPLFLAFELGQLFVGERYLGIRRIRANADPRELPMRNALAATWAVGLLMYFAWMATLLLHPVGRAQGLVLLAVTWIGYGLRAATSLKWTLVILTFEGSIRIGMLLSLSVAVWRQLAP